MAYVIVQHLDPAHHSHLADLLQRHTKLPVKIVDSATAVEPNTVYTSPSDRFLCVSSGYILPRDPVMVEGRRLPIDYFLASLAQSQGERAVAIILSGTGADGSQGVRAVRRAGGLVVAQDPKDAQYGDMPQSAIATGMVDSVLAVDKMVQLLVDYVQKAVPESASPPPEIQADVLNGIMGQLIAHTKCDFRQYKRNTIVRRIYRRMGLKQSSDPRQYLDMLRHNAEEVIELRNDLLIGVTGFFREPEAFEELRKEVLAPRIAEARQGSALRVWVAGCATGEEAYSIAMVVHDEMEKAGKQLNIQIFASDIDESALQIARHGRYDKEAVVDVPEGYLRRYFTQVNGEHLVAKLIREMIVFSVQNLITDPPFSHLDLISCRNVLIYLQSEVQKQVISLFSFALNPGGFLFLGKSDGISGREDLFDLVSKTGRVYRRRAGARPDVTSFPFHPLKELPEQPAERLQERAQRPLPLALVNQEVLLGHYDAAVVLVDKRGTILHFFGDATKYLRLPTGEANLNIISMARDRLALKLRSALHKVLQGEEKVELRRVPITIGDESRPANVTLRLCRPEGWKEQLVAVILEDARPPAEPQPESPELEDAAGVRELELELKATKDELQATYEEFETSSEELKAANEEVMSMNEELQSANEELETSKEELQSINEELTTVNNQLNDKLDELGSINNDLANLLNATPAATIFLDGELKVKRFTPKATDLFNLISEDIGRPIEHISQKFTGTGENILEDARAVLSDLKIVEREVRAAGAWYIVRCLPYRTTDNHIDGVVMSFQDMTRLRQAQRLIEALLGGQDKGVLVVSPDLRVLAASAVAGDVLQLDGELVGKQLYAVGKGDWARSLQPAVEAAFHEGRRQQTTLSLPGGPDGKMRIDVVPLDPEAAPSPQTLVVWVHSAS
jgi:two-component system CheB/CheR fusion protein